MKLIKFLFISLLFFSCNKDYFKWDLDKVNRSPKITLVSINSISNTSVIIDCDVYDNGGALVSQRGVCWSLNTNPSLSNNFIICGNGNGTFSQIISGLSPNTTYYLRAFAINEIDTAYSEEKSFTTTNFSGALPTLTTNSVSGITNNSANSGGNISSDGGSAVTQRGICWNTNVNPTISNNYSVNGTGTGTFSSNMTGLNANTTYYVRAYATNAVGTSYGNQLTLTTSSPPATLVFTNSCASLNGITSLYHGMNGTSANWGISTAGYSGSCWVAPDPVNSGQLGTAVGTHYVEFTKTFSNNGFIEFWLNTYNPGYNNIYPNIYVDGIIQPTPIMIGGQTSSFGFMQVKSSTISGGFHTIKIEFNGSYYVFKLDEIQFFEY